MSVNEQEQITVAPDGKPLEEQPRWRQDFPIDWPQDEYVARRDFVKFLLLTSLAFTTGQFWLLGRSLLRRRESASAMPIVALDDIGVGESLVFRYPEANGAARILVRLDQENLVAYEQQCTHLTCPVIPDVAQGELHCPCHEGFFDLQTGRPLAGPPRRPLARVTLEVRDGTVYATGVEERTV